MFLVFYVDKGPSLKSLFSAIVFLMSILLAGCQQKMSYDYFMQHPHVLKKTLEACQYKTDSYCDEANRAAEDFTALVNERIQDPELFGTKIMRAQQALSTLTKQAYDAQYEKIKILYAVIVETSQGPLANE
jgi:hypothetical protein